MNQEDSSKKNNAIVERADKVLADYSKRTGIALSPDLTEEQRVNIATQLGEFEKKWATMDRAGRRRAFKIKNSSTNRIKTIMKGQMLRDIIVKRYDKHIKNEARKNMPKAGKGIIEEVNKYAVITKF